MDLEQRVDEHELRLRKLETNNIEMQMQMRDISKGQVEIKNMLLERDKRDMEREKSDAKLQEKNQEMMQDLITNLTESMTDTIKSNNSDNTYSKKQFWIFLGSAVVLLSGIVALIGKYFGL